MVKIDTLTLGLYQTNCYVVRNAGESRCVVIDPGYDAQEILQFLTENGLQLEAILLTHGHFDHVGAVKELVIKTDCKLWMNEGDWSQFLNPVSRFYYPLANCDFTEVQFCEDGEHICAAGLEFTVLSTPGHTYGSVCLVIEDAMFSGDTLFAGSCGRTDLPGGDWATIQTSLHKLKALPGDYRIFPGHGEETTLSQEKQCNPYMR